MWYFLFYFSIGVWNSSDSVVFFVLFFYRSLEQFRQCGIFCLFFYRSLEQFRQYGIFCFIFLSEFGTVFLFVFHLISFSCLYPYSHLSNNIRCHGNPRFILLLYGHCEINITKSFDVKTLLIFILSTIPI